MILTRFLYCKDEVELSLRMNLLKNCDIQHIYYWAYELYYSGFDIFAILFKIYLDCYYEKQPYLLNYIKKKQQLWKADGDMKHIAYVLRNMHNLQSTNTVFLARQYMFNYQASQFDFYANAKTAIKLHNNNYDTFGPNFLYRFKNLTITENANNRYKHLRMALHCRHMENVWYYLKALLDKEEMTVITLGKVVGEYLNIEMDEIMLADVNLCEHYIIACIVQALGADKTGTDKTGAPKQQLFVAPKKEHLDYMRALEEDKIPIIYDTLIYKRLIPIDDSIGCFAMERWQWAEHKDFVREIWFHWEYYAMGSPIWLKRLQAYSGTINHMTKKIEFPTEDLHDMFYEQYAYEFDELPKEVQDMSLMPSLKKI